ncbi:4a-hydroxytetrahydrobiopterin dehydratase [Hoyosella sp. G463]|uniref:Putative pterin-4-alpha-carbinolamine dehydratase n=1 Tax=Lolliginicoccus lacisalsi TaxID=2742202 RepID=A0A927JBS8_9ACTN|nr:4a-hydroxytetrahydrobiopterin dehydratase [Lolliginicoccus lacisalsi]MBD8506260.1 4a-hydroxytetrahydrobiopterin dehydratase [Lolliginicoccus lacisalsi]
MSDILDDATIDQFLESLDSWHRDGAALKRTAAMASFPDAILLIDRVAVIAEELDHHPDMDIRWRTVHFSCTTHSAGGLTQRDLDLANQIEAEITSISTS